MTDEKPEHSLEDHRAQVSMVVASLLVTGESGNYGMIDKVNAAKPLGKIKRRDIRPERSGV